MTMLIGLLFAAGATLLLYPQLWWIVSESRRHPEGTEPSPRFLRAARWMGAGFLLAGVLLLIARLRG